MSACRVCKGTRSAHFYWCSEVGGPGVKPAPAEPARAAPTQAEVDARLIEELSAQLPAEPPPPPPPTTRPTRPTPRQTIIALRAELDCAYAALVVQLPGGLSYYDALLPAVPTEPAALTAHVDAIAEKAQAIQQDLRDSLGMRGQLKVVKPRRPQPEPEYPRTEAIRIAKLRDNTAEAAPAPGWRWADGRMAPPEWDKIKDWDLEAVAIEMVSICREGLPADVPYLVRDDVLACEGIPDEAVIEAALRHPERVTVRPETQDRDKRYPVLSFRRGDVNVILGTQFPERPAVIAAYWVSMLMGYDPTLHRERTGGGGSKAKGSIPTTATALVKRLKALGAEIREDPAKLTATVKYDGQDLGKINLGEHLPKATVDSDWQRTQRRIHAIDQRAAKVGGR